MPSWSTFSVIEIKNGNLRISVWVYTNLTDLVHQVVAFSYNSDLGGVSNYYKYLLRL